MGKFIKEPPKMSSKEAEFTKTWGRITLEEYQLLKERKLTLNDLANKRERAYQSYLKQADHQSYKRREEEKVLDRIKFGARYALYRSQGYTQGIGKMVSDKQKYSEKNFKPVYNVIKDQRERISKSITITDDEKQFMKDTANFSLEDIRHRFTDYLGILHTLLGYDLDAYLSPQEQLQN
jgi:hypothetical protein